jgi:aldose 1-epimerase
MSFRVHERQEANALGRDPTVCVLEDGRGNELHVWPALGFNAFQWSAGHRDILYRDPSFFNELKPTRSGFPVLFPFPNRIRDGRFTWAGQAYQLPLNDPTGKNAIHGFAAQRAWRVIGRGGDDKEAWLTGEFHGSRDAADAALLWPCDYRLRLTYRLLGGKLRIETVVDNPDRLALPFGLGYHPYFRMAVFGGRAAQVSLFARGQWELDRALPTGKKQDIAPLGDIRFADTQLDDLYTDVERRDDDSVLVAALRSDGGLSLRLTASRDFRELVAFTPPHREAICFEPYTCATDAINLQQHGIDAGLRVLAPREQWSGWVELTLNRELQEESPSTQYSA